MFLLKIIGVSVSSLVNISAALDAGSGLASGIILAAAFDLFLIYTMCPVMGSTIVFRANCATLKKWCRSLKSQPHLLEQQGLCNYLKALAMADNAMSDSIFHISIGASMSLLVSLYRAYSLAIGKIKKLNSLWQTL